MYIKPESYSTMVFVRYIHPKTSVDAIAIKAAKKVIAELLKIVVSTMV